MCQSIPLLRLNDPPYKDVVLGPYKHRSPPKFFQLHMKTDILWRALYFCFLELQSILSLAMGSKMYRKRFLQCNFKI